MDMSKAQAHQAIANLLALLEHRLPNGYLVCDSGTTIEFAEFTYFMIRDRQEFIDFKKLGGNYSVISTKDWAAHLSNPGGISFTDMRLIWEK